jgi:hypothetical protein
MFDQSGQSPPGGEWQQPGAPQQQPNYPPPGQYPGYPPPGQYPGQVSPYGYPQPAYLPGPVPPPGRKKKGPLFFVLVSVAGVVLLLFVIGFIGGLVTAAKGGSGGTGPDASDQGCTGFIRYMRAYVAQPNKASLDSQLQYYQGVGDAAAAGGSSYDPTLRADMNAVMNDNNALQGDNLTSSANDAADIAKEQSDLAKVNRLCGTSY